MIGPFAYWTRVMSGWQTVSETGTQLAETTEASQQVIAARANTIRDAVTSPLTADYAELSRMVPEKIAAFSIAGSAVVDAWFTMQAEHAAQAKRVGAMMLRGRPPTLSEVSVLASQSSMYALRVFEKGARGGRDALAPVRKAAGANAKRLGKRRGPSA
ncbi:MAG: hypothetical protein ABIS14_07715 [Sphingomonas sp.]